MPSGNPLSGRYVLETRDCAHSSVFPSPDVPHLPIVQASGHAQVSAGVYLHYKSYGDPASQDKILLIMGLSVSKEHWMGLVQGLLLSSNARHNDDQDLDPQEPHILIFDNRGSSESFFSTDALGRHARESRYSTEIMAQDAIAIMDHMGWSSAHIMGVSLGGMIAQKLAVLVPTRVKSLTLGATAPSFRSIAWDLLRHEPRNALAIVFQALTGNPDAKYADDATIRARLPLMFPTAYLTPENVNRLSAAILAIETRVPDTAPDVVAAQIRALRTHALTTSECQILRQASFRILILAGAGDRLVHVSSQRRLYKGLISDHTFYVEFPDAGHGLTTQYPDAVAALVLQTQVGSTPFDRVHHKLTAVEEARHHHPEETDKHDRVSVEMHHLV